MTLCPKCGAEVTGFICKCDALTLLEKQMASCRSPAEQLAIIDALLSPPIEDEDGDGWDANGAPC